MYVNQRRRVHTSEFGALYSNGELITTSGPLPRPAHLSAGPVSVGQVTYKMKQKKRKAVGGEMRFGVNTAAPFVGMKREEGSDYPFAKQVNSDILPSVA